jgi:hypothetical protein
MLLTVKIAAQLVDKTKHTRYTENKMKFELTSTPIAIIGRTVI